jgi:uncharacterized damage-inducible protein DinB
MPLVDAIREEFDSEAPVTRRVLARVPLDRREWKPHPKSMELGRLAAWMANAPGWTASVLFDDTVEASTWTPFPAPEKSAELLATFDAGVESARSAMARLDDAVARGNWSFVFQGKPMLTLPRLGFLRLFLLSDAIHHRGQMSVFLRLLDVPVPSIYGPSADEQGPG